MEKKCRNIFPGLERSMSQKSHDCSTLASILGLSYISVKKRLSGEVEFELTEVKKLMREYDTSFERLFL